MFLIIDCTRCLLISVVSMKFANMELLTSSCRVPFPWRKAWNDTDNQMHFNSMLLMSANSVPSEERYWTKVLLMVIWPPPDVPLLRTGFLAHSLPLKADSLFSKQVRENRKDKFRDCGVNFEQNFDCVFSPLVVCLKNNMNLEARKWNGRHYQPT